MKEGARVVENPAIKTNIKDGHMLIDIPIEQHPMASRNGGSIVVASTHGILDTKTKYKDRPVMLQVNALVDFTL
jgi:hypothetical protein